jgi:hypothetical protein
MERNFLRLEQIEIYNMGSNQKLLFTLGIFTLQRVFEE